MAVTDPTQSRTAIYYKETIPPPDSVEFNENSLCVGRHGKPIIQASSYSGQLYCKDCLALGSGGQALHCQCCNAVVGDAPQKPFSNCIKVSGINADETPEYLCQFCKDDLIKPEEIAQFTQLAQIWFQIFLKEASQAAPQLVWTFSEDPKINPRKLSEILSLGGHVTGVTQSEPYRKSSNDTKDSYTH
ncbi:MAG TPA: hypothetical protein VFN35_36680, partial [Ktedonobacteraceae bacterium]|nr:hypothetical protein [Ktedonobacteraceae bacterium]